jgi:hypothetical protein
MVSPEGPPLISSLKLTVPGAPKVITTSSKEMGVI